MVNPVRLLVVAVAVNMTVGAVAAAAAQTVVVRDAQAGEAVEVVLNATKVASGTVGANGMATVPINIQEALGKAEIDANIAFDTCGTLRRVFIVEQGRQMPVEEEGCRRRADIDLFLVRRQHHCSRDGTAESARHSRPGPIYSQRGSTGTRGASRPDVFRGCRADSVPASSASVWPAVTCPSARAATDVRANFATSYWLTRRIGVEATYWNPGTVVARGAGDTCRVCGQSLRDRDAHVVARSAFPSALPGSMLRQVAFPRAMRDPANQRWRTMEQTLILGPRAGWRTAEASRSG